MDGSLKDMYSRAPRHAAIAMDPSRPQGPVLTARVRRGAGSLDTQGLPPTSRPWAPATCVVVLRTWVGQQDRAWFLTSCVRPTGSTERARQGNIRCVATHFRCVADLLLVRTMHNRGQAGGRKVCRSLGTCVLACMFPARSNLPNRRSTPCVVQKHNQSPLTRRDKKQIWCETLLRRVQRTRRAGSGSGRTRQAPGRGAASPLVRRAVAVAVLGAVALGPPVRFHLIPSPSQSFRHGARQVRRVSVVT